MILMLICDLVLERIERVKAWRDSHGRAKTMRFPHGIPRVEVPGEDVAPYPHCSTEVLHAPGTCKYCDMYPDRQAQHAASRTPFTPAEANGWGGNIAVSHDDPF